MKQFITLLLLLMVTTPVFATAGWHEGCNDDVVVIQASQAQEFFRNRAPNDQRPVVIEDPEAHQYYEELVKAYDKKYHYYDEQGRGHYRAPIGAFQREVEAPMMEYIMKHPYGYNASSPKQIQERKKNKETLDRLRKEQQKKEVLRKILYF